MYCVTYHSVCLEVYGILAAVVTFFLSFFFFFSSRRRHTRCSRDWSSDVCSSDLYCLHEGVWNLEALQHSEEIILCEALIDALTFWCAGYRNVTASYGTSGFTDDHLAAFKQYRSEERRVGKECRSRWSPYH